MSKYQKMTLEKLIDESDQTEEELVNLRLKHSQGKLRDTARLKKTKKELARINTFINQKVHSLEENE